MECRSNVRSWAAINVPYRHASSRENGALMSDPMNGYEKRSFTAPIRGDRSVTHDVYEKGEGPPVVVIQELPGIGPETLTLADRLVEAGHTVILPHLFGPLGRVSFAGNIARVMCMRREFRLFASNQSSPIVDWLRSLCVDVKDRTGAAGVGAIGMCLTGNFAISLIADDSVLAAVASQPSMPLFKQSALHMSHDEIEQSKGRLDDVGPMLAFRIAGDSICKAEKFTVLNEMFNGDGRERIRLETLPGKGHSVLTLDFVDDDGHPTHLALQSILGYFRERLHGA